jgi:hypothetical protein
LPKWPRSRPKQHLWTRTPPSQRDACFSHLPVKECMTIQPVQQVMEAAIVIHLRRMGEGCICSTGAGEGKASLNNFKSDRSFTRSWAGRAYRDAGRRLLLGDLARIHGTMTKRHAVAILAKFPWCRRFHSLGPSAH